MLGIPQGSTPGGVVPQDAARGTQGSHPVLPIGGSTSGHGVGRVRVSVRERYLVRKGGGEIMVEVHV